MPIDEPGSFEPKAVAADARKPKSAGASAEQAPSGEILAFTVDAGSGRIIKIEGVDPAGARHELSDAERGRLAAGKARATLQAVIEEAFQAGIDCVLGDGDDEPPPSKEDAELSRLLLLSLIARSGAKRLMQRDVLHRAIVGTLIQQAAAPGGAAH